ncbi:MAG: hypothetical protein IPL65_05880 [Lewinellaceae bacterium]|nr:hypothetical protein [Lewinellaceae bacterium]
MQEQENIDLIIYRVREKGLEVFLVNNDEAKDVWSTLTPEESKRLTQRSIIELDAVTDANGQSRKAIAVEADWHEFPSLRALMYEDYRVAKEKAKLHLKSLFDHEKGAFVAVKETFKRLLPEQYAFVKELKEVLIEKNSTENI